MPADVPGEGTEITSDEQVVTALENPPRYQPFPSFGDFTTDTFDPATLSQFVDMMESLKSSVGNEQLEAAVTKATKWAAVDTGAIEGLYEVERGFTFTVATEAAAWDNMHLLVGEPAQRAINDALEAYEWMLDAATETRPITESWIKELHQVICRAQETYTVITAAGRQEHVLEKGTYKRYPNNPLNFDSAKFHAYAPVDDTAPEMQRLVNELSSEAFQAAHPVVQAAYSHYAYVCIHPFPDGNGRVARALASVFLYRSPGVPLVIFADQKPAYLDALELADAGTHSMFVQFIAERAVDVVRMVVDDMRRPARPSLNERLAEMRQSLLGRGGLSHTEVDALASLLFDELHSAFLRTIANNQLDPPLSAKAQVATGPLPAPSETHRNVPNARRVMLTVTSDPPATASVQYFFGVLVAKGTQDAADFVVAGGSPVGLLLEALIRDVKPTVSPALTYRLDSLTEHAFLSAVDAAIAAGEQQLRSSGYR
jgi:Fic family protein